MYEKWEHAGAFAATARYSIHLTSSAAIGLNDGVGHQQALRVDGRDHEMYQVGKWVAESNCRQNGQEFIYDIFLQCKLPCDDHIEINSSSGDLGKITVSLEGERKEVKTFQEVTSLRISPNKVCGIYSNAAAPSSSTSRNTPVQVPTPTSIHTPSSNAPASNEELTKLRNDLAQEREKTEILRKALAESKKKEDDLTHQLEEDKKRSSDLRAIADRDASTSISDLAATNTQIQEELSSKVAEIARLSEAIDNTKEQIEAKAKQITDLQAELARLSDEKDRLESSAEQTTLDLDAAKQDLETLKSVCEADRDVVTFMEDDPILKGRGVRKTLDGVKKELEAVEKRLTWLINAKEASGAAIRNSILSGDGTVSLEDEKGVLKHGNDSEGEDTGS